MGTAAANPFRQPYAEGNDRFTCQCADHRRQNQKDLVPPLMTFGHAVYGEFLHQLQLVVCTLISGECPTRNIPHRVPFEGERESWERNSSP